MQPLENPERALSNNHFMDEQLAQKARTHKIGGSKGKSLETVPRLDI